MQLAPRAGALIRLGTKDGADPVTSPLTAMNLHEVLYGQIPGHNLTDGTFYCHVHTKHRDGRTTRSWQRFSHEVIARANAQCQLRYEGCTYHATTPTRSAKANTPSTTTSTRQPARAATNSCTPGTATATTKTRS